MNSKLHSCFALCIPALLPNLVLLVRDVLESCKKDGPCRKVGKTCYGDSLHPSSGANGFHFCTALRLCQNLRKTPENIQPNSPRFSSPPPPCPSTPALLQKALEAPTCDCIMTSSQTVRDTRAFFRFRMLLHLRLLAFARTDEALNVRPLDKILN